MKLLQRLTSEAPMLEQGALTALLSYVRLTIPQMAEHPYLKGVREQCKPKMEIIETNAGNIAAVPIHGMLAHNPDAWEMAYGVEDSRNVLEMLSEATSSRSIKAILLDFDSPGGFYTGGPEMADSIADAGKRKPVCAWTGGTMASLAYWAGSQASTVIASRGAMVGSIGAYMTFVDYSKMLKDAGISVEVFKNKAADFKAIGVPGTALTDAQRDHLQANIEARFAEFADAVRSTRPKVSDDSMRGQVFTGTEAQAAGLVDFVGSRDAALRLLQRQL